MKKNVALLLFFVSTRVIASELLVQERIIEAIDAGPKQKEEAQDTEQIALVVPEPAQQSKMPYYMQLLMAIAKKKAAQENHKDEEDLTPRSRAARACTPEEIAIMESYHCSVEHDPDAFCKDCSCQPIVKHHEECKPCAHGLRGCETGCTKGCDLKRLPCKIIGKHRHDCLVCEHGKRDCSTNECPDCRYCAMCLKLIGKDYEITSCGHAFCGPDIRRWQEEFKDNCPECRKTPITYLNKTCDYCDEQIEVNDKAVTISCVVRYWSSLSDGFEERHPRDKFLQPTNFSHRFHERCYDKLDSGTPADAPCPCPKHCLEYDSDPLYDYDFGYLQLRGRNNQEIAKKFLKTYMADVLSPGREQRPVVPIFIQNAVSSMITWFGNKYLKPQ